jgi:TonB family protein
MQSLSPATSTSMLRALRLLSIVMMLGLTTALAGCGDRNTEEIKSLKEQVQRAYGSKDFAKVLGLSQKGLTLARQHMGDTAADTLYFVQAISEANLNMRNMRGAISALKQELSMRAAAKQTEQRLQPRRTLLIQLAEQNGDKLTAAEQAVLVAKGIEMGPGKDPQAVYRTQVMYPPQQFQQKIEGDVEIGYGLDATGAVVGAYIKKANPTQVFDQAALESFRQWRFTPMLDNAGRPISASGFTFTLAFRLKGDRP